MAASHVALPVTSRRAIVVGAGIAGLTAAFRLRQRGFEVTVLEAGPALGGRMSSWERDGFVLNGAARMIPKSYGELVGLVEDLGLERDVTELVLRIGLLRDGTIHELRTGGFGVALDGLRTRVLSWPSKLLMRRLVVDALRIRGSLSFANAGLAQRFDTETAAQYCARRLNDELRDYLVDPLCRGLLFSGADRVSVVDFFSAALTFVGVGVMGYPGGADFIGQAIADHVEVRTRCRVLEVHRHDDGATVRWRSGEQEHSERVDGCVVAVSGTQVGGIYSQLDEVQAKVLDERLDYSMTCVATFALSRRPELRPLVVTVPKPEIAGLCAVTLDHNIQRDAAPPGKGLISSFWLHEWALEHAELSDEQLIEVMMPSLEKVIPGVADLVEFTEVRRWEPAALRSYPGMYQHVSNLVERVEPGQRVQLAGDYFSVTSLNASAVSGSVAGQRLADCVMSTE